MEIRKISHADQKLEIRIKITAKSTSASRK
jgi:hypothetical protein